MTYVTIQLVGVTCYSCGVTFGLDRDHYDNLVNSHKGFYCPNGHNQHFTGKSEAEIERARNEQLRESLEAARRLARIEANRREHAERSANAYKGQVTKVKRRVGKGVCPCCNRFFPQLHDHMATDHPDYAESDGDQA